MKLGIEAQKVLIQLYKDNSLYIEGSILKLIEDEGSTEFRKYLDGAQSQDREKRRTRLEITKEVSKQNEELKVAQSKNETLMVDLKLALDEAQKAKKTALDDLGIIQKKTQFELIHSIVNVALRAILGVGISTTLLYAYALQTNKDTTLVGNTWSNMFGILLTNSFSIIGTIMGVKYASEKAPPNPPPSN